MVDSQAALLALKSNSVSDSLIYDCIKRLNVLCRKKFKVKLSWVRAHKGTKWNEHVDNLAKSATKIKVFGPEPIIPWTKKVFGNGIKSKLREIWAKRWKRKTMKNNKPLYRQVKEIFLIIIIQTT